MVRIQNCNNMRRNATDEELKLLAIFFIECNLLQKGWEYHEFVNAYLDGHVQLGATASVSKKVNKFTSLLKK